MAKTPTNENTRCLRKPHGHRNKPIRPAAAEW